MVVSMSLKQYNFRDKDGARQAYRMVKTVCTHRHQDPTQIKIREKTIIIPEDYCSLLEQIAGEVHAKYKRQK